MTVSSRTTNFRFGLIDFASRPWSDDEHANWTKLDGLLQILSDSVPFVGATGSGNAYIANYDPAITAYTEGLILSFQPNHTNTGASTLNVNGLGAKDICVSGAAVPADLIQEDGYVRVIYDGTCFVVIQASIPSSVGATLPSQATHAGKLLTTNGVSASWSTLAAITEYSTDRTADRDEAVALAIAL